MKSDLMEIVLIEQKLYAMKIVPLARHYVWGGNKLKSFFSNFEDMKSPLAEVWLIGEDNLIENGFLAGRTIQEASKEFGVSLLGKDAAQKNDNRFPILIKVLDCAQWLSLQVHPDDQQANQLEGPEFRGKTESWYILDAEPEAKLIAGLKPGITKQVMGEKIRQGEVMDLVQYHLLHQDDTVFVGAGTVHALGPGILVYEVQQMSDLTYRIYDWDRPLTDGRTLHVEKSLEVIDPAINVGVDHYDSSTKKFSRPLVHCEKFNLEAVESCGESIALDTKGDVFIILTVIDGEARLSHEEFQLDLRKYETVLVPAGCDVYQISGRFKALKTNVL